MTSSLGFVGRLGFIVSVAAALAATGCQSNAEGFGPDDGGAEDAEGEQRPDARPDRPPPDMAPDVQATPDASPPDQAPPDLAPVAQVDMAPAVPPPPFCGIGMHTAAPAPPETTKLMMLVDRSGSMAETLPNSKTTRWTAVVNALDGILQKTNDRVAWGLKFFPTTRACEVADGADAPLSLGNAMAISDLIHKTKPIQEPNVAASPVHLGLRKAAAYLASQGGQGIKAVVLATDGYPNCAGQEGREAALKAAADIAAMGVKTYLIAVHTNDAATDQFMNTLATAGGDPNQGSRKYYLATDQAAISAALEKITQNITRCVYVVPTPPPAPDFVALQIGGQRIPRDKDRANGWDWGVGYQSVQVYGPACDVLRQQAAATAATLLYGCQGVQP